MMETDPVLAEKLEYVLDPGLPSAAAAKPMDAPKRGTLAMDHEPDAAELKAETPSFEQPELRADFNAFPDANGLKDFVAVEPAADFTVEAVDDWRGSGLVLRGDFKPGDIYEVTFKEGLPAANGSSLPQDDPPQRAVPAAEAGGPLDAPGRYLSPRGTLSRAGAAVNLKEYVARLRPVYANNLVELARRESDWYYYGSLTADLDGPARTTNALPPAKDGGRCAARWICARWRAASRAGCTGWSRRQNAGRRRLLVVTDLGVAARTFRAARSSG
jgi:hypothetical protein